MGKIIGEEGIKEDGIWQPTVRLRWHHTRITIGVSEFILQQLWVNCNTGEKQWEDVPTE